MITGLLGKKIGMTHYFSSEAEVVPVTVVEVGPCIVTQVKTVLSDGYDAIQVGYGRAKQLTKPKKGHLKSNGDLKYLREFSSTDFSQHTVGEELRANEFRPGEYVDITATSKGRGFQGVVRRHGYGGGPKTHGQGDRQRSPGSIGAGTYPGRVFKGKAMPGRMGGKQVTVKKLRIERVDLDRNLLLVRGAIPGSTNGFLVVRHTELDESKLPPRVEEDNNQEPETSISEVSAPEAPVAEAVDTPVAEAEDTPVADVEDTPVAEAEDTP
ncbi:MAG: 50S ribosomal protein L3, partial [Dehalococcoidia bacterium]|nr:50S ribosomal protein L3 [Dehalococcoidia bacterium]